MYFYCYDRQVQKVRQQSNSNMWKQSPTYIEKNEIQIYWTTQLVQMQENSMVQQKYIS